MEKVEDKTKDAAIELLETDNKIKEMDKEIARLKQEREYLIGILHAEISGLGLEAIKVNNASFTPKEEQSCSIVSERQQEAFEYLEQQGVGDIIKPTVNFNTLNAMFRKGEIKFPEDCPFIKTWTKKKIAIRRS